MAREYARDFMVYTFAKSFGWRENQTLRHSNVRLKHLAWIIDEAAREEERQMKRKSA